MERLMQLRDVVKVTQTVSVDSREIVKYVVGGHVANLPVTC
jgi:hypothetical protein